jgi:Rrf2 family protein
MLELTRKSDYALRFMVQVAAADAGAMSVSDISTQEEIPHEFLRKIATELVTAGLLISTRGPRGGFRLARRQQDISLLDIVRAVEDTAIRQCVVDPLSCTRRSRCAVYPVWHRLQQEMERAMALVPLSDMADRHRLMEQNTTAGSRTLDETGSRSTRITARPFLDGACQPSSL